MPQVVAAAANPNERTVATNPFSPESTAVDAPPADPLSQELVLEHVAG
jgi:hypothetical protein